MGGKPDQARGQPGEAAESDAAGSAVAKRGTPQGDVAHDGFPVLLQPPSQATAAAAAAAEAEGGDRKSVV